METGKQRFDMSKETSSLINALENAQVGQLLTYDELSLVAHGDVRGRCQSHLIVARKHLLREHRILFGVVRNVGLKRMTDAEAVLAGEKGLGAVRRAARRSVRRSLCVQDFAALPEEMKAKHNATVSIMGAIDLAVSPPKVKQIAEAVKSANDRLAIGQTLDLFNR